MAPEGAGRRLLTALVGAAFTLVGAAAWGDARAGTSARIYQCVLPDGRKLNSDKPIAECSTQGKPQLELNSDGSPRQVIEAPLTEDEKAERERLQRQRDADRKERDIAARSDRDLVRRYPNEQYHAKAREGALEVVRASVRNSEERIRALQKERKPLLDEAEFYADPKTNTKAMSGVERTPLPQRIKLGLDANDAALEAQKSLVANQQIEIARINARYDVELDRLRKLWGGAVAGSLGPMPRSTDVAPPAK